MAHKVINEVTERIVERSSKSREKYITRIKAAASEAPSRKVLSCGNLAHGFAACGADDKKDLSATKKANIAIVSAYNDMLSAHQPYKNFPDIIKEAAHKYGAVAQFAGGVPAMCDGITQGQPGMDLSLFSRDVIAQATAIALSHNMFDGVLCLGICDKIVPGLLIGSLSFGHLPIVFVPGGPMPSSLPHKEKGKVRQLYEQGKATKEELLAAEANSYNAPGTCSFYGTANSNQMLMEIMGLHLPGSSFVSPNTPMRDELTRQATRQVIENTSLSGKARPLYSIIDERSFVNAIVGLLATGGSTNHTIHLIAIARAAGIKINWDDFSDLSAAVPLLTRIYPNGEADVNQFHEAGGMSFIINQLLDAGLLHEDVNTILGKGLDEYTKKPDLNGDKISWKKSDLKSSDEQILRPADNPFNKDGGIKLLKGNLGRAIVKTSAVKPQFHHIEAPAIVFKDQKEFLQKFKDGELHKDFVAVVKFQGPQANGMPELHRLSPTLAVLQDLGFKVALITDGRMSGASGKVLAVIHVTPESSVGGALTKIKNGDILNIDAAKGILEVKENGFDSRKPEEFVRNNSETGMGRELFSNMRKIVSSAEEGASFIVNSELFD